MNLKKFCEGINLDPGAQQLVYEYHMDEGSYLINKKQFYDDRFSFFEAVKQKGAYRQLLLYLFVRFACDAYEEYRIREIDDEIYYDTFSDIQIWCMSCLRDFGEYGIEEYNWLQEHVQLRLFRLGRLQFQPYTFNRDLVVKGRKIFKNQIVLNIHIPEGESLTPQKVSESFESASVFFKGITPVFICQTWLLYPELSKILSVDSNIIQFQKKFNIFEVDEDSKQAEQRIFNKLKANPTEYEDRTKLQRDAKAYLIAGHKLGSGYGIRIHGL